MDRRSTRTVLVTQRLLETTEYVEDREALDTRWGQFFRDMDLLPIPMMTSCAAEEYLQAVSPVMTGGNDLSALSSNRLSHQRDKFETSLVHAAIQHGIPIFAVCRGAQFIAQMCGLQLEKHGGHVGTTHQIQANPQSIYHSILQEMNQTNSFHGYCVIPLREQELSFPITPKDLHPTHFKNQTQAVTGIVSAVCKEDQTIEAFEIPELRILAVMWHPERVSPFHPNDKKLILTHFSLN